MFLFQRESENILTKVWTRIPLPLRWRDELSFFVFFGERLFWFDKYDIIALAY